MNWGNRKASKNTGEARLSADPLQPHHCQHAWAQKIPRCYRTHTLKCELCSLSLPFSSLAAQCCEGSKHQKGEARIFSLYREIRLLVESSSSHISSVFVWTFYISGFIYIFTSVHSGVFVISLMACIYIQNSGSILLVCSAAFQRIVYYNILKLAMASLTYCRLKKKCFKNTMNTLVLLFILQPPNLNLTYNH